MVPVLVTQEGTYLTRCFFDVHAWRVHAPGRQHAVSVDLRRQHGRRDGPSGLSAVLLACGIGAALAHVLAAPLSQVPTVGASGAIAGVMGGYLLLYPKRAWICSSSSSSSCTVFAVPAWIMLGLWFMLQLFGRVWGDPSMGGVAYWAHAGGFVVGLALGGAGLHPRVAEPVLGPDGRPAAAPRRRIHLQPHQHPESEAPKMMGPMAAPPAIAARSNGAFASRTGSGPRGAAIAASAAAGAGLALDGLRGGRGPQADIYQVERGPAALVLPVCGIYTHHRAARTRFMRPEYRRLEA